MTNWDKIREQFPIVENVTYLNSASASPISKEAAIEGKRFYDEILMYGDSNWEEWLLKIEDTREKVAKLINADKNEIAFIPNTSFGMNIIAEMLEGKGDIITMNDEFPSSTLPWINKNFKIKYICPDNNIYLIEKIKKQITKKTNILITSHVQFSTGFKQDLITLGETCKKNHLIYVVNATQSIGAMQIDVKKSNIDFLTFSSVKWLMTGEGIGALYINKKWHKKIKWPMVGWLSVKNPEECDNKNLILKDDPSVLEIGALCLHSIFVMGKAIDFIFQIGTSNIENRIYELSDYLIKKLKGLDLEILSPIEKKYRSGIVFVKIQNPETIAQELHKSRVIVSAIKEGLRISVHIYNNNHDIDIFIYKLKKLLIEYNSIS